ncbi:hypothetical protein [Pseudoalteromonas sp. T1lg88]|uniref:hypothetical protein n=1 Tax=Pseudoalteromonas sp. T1lg88 TaxID=2077104 RepID=UPI000CF61EE8|nr:hypothetical protein [Pseudoalteromonas sp. T1lg88]
MKLSESDFKQLLAVAKSPKRRFTKETVQARFERSKGLYQKSIESHGVLGAIKHFIFYNNKYEVIQTVERLLSEGWKEYGSPQSFYQFKVDPATKAVEFWMKKPESLQEGDLKTLLDKAEAELRVEIDTHNQSREDAIKALALHAETVQAEKDKEAELLGQIQELAEGL